MPLKPIDTAIVKGWSASHRAVTRVNAEVARKCKPGGRVRNRRTKAAWRSANWLKRCGTPAGW